MSVGLRGELGDFGIAEVFQLIGQQRKSGVLDLKNGSRHVQIAFDRGFVVRAAPMGPRPYEALGAMLRRCGLLTRERVDELSRECVASAQSLGRRAVAAGDLSERELREIQDLLTHDAIFEILLWTQGSFDFTGQEVTHDRPFETLLGAEQILMDGLRMADEWQTFADRVPADDAVLRRAGDIGEYEIRARGEVRREGEKARRLYALVDGRLPARRVADLSRLGTFDAMRVLAEMIRIGIVEAGAPARRGARPSVRGARGGGASRRRAATLLPFAFLAAVAALAWVAGPGPERPDRIGTPFPNAAGSAARRAHEARRARHALESFRFAAGRWPESPRELVRRGLLPEDALAGPEGRAYYYVRRDGEAILLAPER